MRSPVSARVTGFDYTTHHAYTTEVAVDGRSWSLAIRYNTFFRFYAKLLEVEPQFRAPFPPKGGLFFSPQPEERQVQLDDFLQNTLTFFDLRGRPEPMGALLDDLLEISEHLDAPQEEEEEEEEQASAEETKVEKKKEEEEQASAEETKVEKKKEEEAPVLGGLLNSKWAKALVSAAMQAVVVNTFQENVEAAKTKVVAAEEPAKGKAVNAADVDTPASPASRASLTKTPRQSATVAPLEVASPFETPTKTETKAETKPKLRVDTKTETPVDNAPVVVATVAVGGVRDRIAVWERRASSPTLPTPRSAGRRSSSCSSVGDQAPVVPLGLLDAPKPVVESDKTQEVTVEKKVEQQVAVEKAEEEEATTDDVAVESKTATTGAEEETTVETEAPSVEQTPKEEDAAVVEEVAAEEVAAVETEKEAAAETTAVKTTAVETTTVEITTVETKEMETEPAAESDGYDSDASAEMRRLGLEKLDVNERLRFYRHPVFFQGFHCHVRTSLVANEAGRA